MKSDNTPLWLGRDMTARPHYWSAALRVRIYTMGVLRVMFNDHQEFPACPLLAAVEDSELLKVLIALGGRDVAETRMAAALWPCADSLDAGRRFDAKLTHLQQWFKAYDVLRVENGMVSLDERHCWVDTWALDRTQAIVRDMLRDPTADLPQDLAGQMERLLRLYRGDFLDGDCPRAWSLGLRERLRSSFVNTLAELGDYWLSRDDSGRALRCCHEGLSIDSSAKPLYEILFGYALARENQASEWEDDGSDCYEPTPRGAADPDPWQVVNGEALRPSS